MEKEINSYEAILLTLFILILLFLAVLTIKWRDTDNKVNNLRTMYEEALTEQTTETTAEIKVIYLPKEPDEVVISYGGE